MENVKKYFNNPSPPIEEIAQLTPENTPKRLQRKSKTPNKKTISETSDKKTISVMPAEKQTRLKSLKIYYQNVRSIKDKMEDFKYDIARKYHIIMLTETWLDNKKNKKNMVKFSADFELFRQDRSADVLKDNGGGVMIAISNKLGAKQRKLDEKFNHLEYVCVEILDSEKPIWLYCVYIPESTKELYKDHFDAIRSIQMTGKDILIVGDFNLRLIVWNTTDEVTYEPEYRCERFNLRSGNEIKFDELNKLHTDLQTEFGVCQLCGAKNKKENVLDLVYSNKKDDIKIKSTEEHMSKADPAHVTLDITIENIDISLVEVHKTTVHE